mmetsp:Transcript_10589/g.65169  ORF Transcript_10589/g.65169 Transcript_10589/m.65169 type:complete len:413 (+) Transcript_10589:9766-11004(+)
MPWHYSVLRWVSPVPAARFLFRIGVQGSACVSGVGRFDLFDAFHQHEICTHLSFHGGWDRHDLGVGSSSAGSVFFVDLVLFLFAFLVPYLLLECVQFSVDLFLGTCEQLGEAGSVRFVVQLSGGEASGELGAHLVPFDGFFGVFLGDVLSHVFLVCLDTVAFCPGHLDGCGSLLLTIRFSSQSQDDVGRDATLHAFFLPQRFVLARSPHASARPGDPSEVLIVQFFQHTHQQLVGQLVRIPPSFHPSRVVSLLRALARPPRPPHPSLSLSFRPSVVLRSCRSTRTCASNLPSVARPWESLPPSPSKGRGGGIRFGLSPEGIFEASTPPPPRIRGSDRIGPTPPPPLRAKGGGTSITSDRIPRPRGCGGRCTARRGDVVGRVDPRTRVVGVRLPRTPSRKARPIRPRASRPLG